MKIKTYLIILIVLFILLFYNLFCYSFANKRIDDATRFIITDYFRNNNYSSQYKYIKASANNDGTINVFVDNNEYFRFIISYNGQYKIVNVNKDIPNYIK